VFRISPSGTETTLYSFAGYPNDGANPYAGLVQGSDGNFYGTTYYGGGYNYGTVFRISPSGTETTLYNFAGYPNDGAYPYYAALVEGSDGNFYGTTLDGGTHNYGTVFRISPSGTETILYNFGNGSGDGKYPRAALVEGSDGNFYGTTYYGGGYNYGTVFRISPGGSYEVIYTFQNSRVPGAPPIGAYPSGLVQGSDGNFYGTTAAGGQSAACGSPGCGSVFRVTPSGSYTVLHSFAPTTGVIPRAGLVQGSDGNFYGTTYYGGPSNSGTVFRVSVSGSYTSLYFFAGFPSDGANPQAALVQGSDGNFYGTTYDGGTNSPSPGAGTVFRIDAGLCTYTYGVTVSSSPAGGGSTTGTGVYGCGSNVTVCATASLYYSFVNWTDQNSNVLSTSACYTFAATTNDVLVANFTAVDSVGDGIPDWWRAQYFSGGGTNTNNVSCATCDADGTGQNNFFKYVAGLDPTNPASVFVLSIASATNLSSSNNLFFTPLALARTYTPQFTTDLVSGVWGPLTTYVGPATNINGTQVTITDTNPIPPAEFYRIQISLP
jgi:uncharacterized repeat protein (TIGR03803 family)